MERIKQQVDHLQQQLAGLSIGQKLLTGTLVAVMLATVVWWVHRASTDASVALFDQPLAAPEAAEVREMLASAGIEAHVMDNQVFVAADAREKAMTLLAREHLPMGRDPIADSLGAFSIFDSPPKAELLQQLAQESKLSRTIGGWNGVRAASVHLNRTYRRQIGEPLLPSAAVDIATVGEPDLRELADAATKIVSRAESGLKPENVTVVIDGRPIEAGVPVERSPSLAMHADAERYFAGLVRKALPEIPSLAVTVAVDIAPGEQLASSEQAPDVSASTAYANLPELLEGVLLAGDAGARANEPRRIAHDSPPAPAATAPRPRPTACAMSVPLSWLIQQWQARAQTDVLPDAVELAEFEALKLAELQQYVSMSLGGIPAEQVYVTVDADGGMIAGAPAGPAGTEEAAGISSLLRDYGREIAIAALAAVGVLLASTMLKKGGALALSTAAHPEVAGTLSGLEPVEWEVGDVAMTAEMDALVGQAGEMLEQVQSLVRQHPADAASMVERWLAVR